MQVFKTGITSIPFYSIGGANKVHAPCLDCDRREVGCHGKCREYQEYKTRVNEVNDTIYKNKQKLKNPRSEAFLEYVKSYSGDKKIKRYYT